MRGICGYNCDICCYKAVASGFYSNGNLQSVFFTARRYASVVFAVVVCPSVRLSVRHKPALYRNYCTNRALILARRPSGRTSTYLTLWYKEIPVSPKIRVLSSGTMFQTQHFATANRSLCQQNTSSSSTVELVDNTHTHTTIDDSWLFATSRSTVTLIIQLVSTVDKILIGVDWRHGVVAAFVA